MPLTKKEIEEIKERAKALAPDEREAILEALEPDILKKVIGLINGQKLPDPDPKTKPKRGFLDVLLGTERSE